MNLEYVSAGRDTYCHTQVQPQTIQLPLFPKRFVYSPYRISRTEIELILRKISARGLCSRSQVEGYLRKKLRHNCQLNIDDYNLSTWSNTLKLQTCWCLQP